MFFSHLKKENLKTQIKNQKKKEKIAIRLINIGILKKNKMDEKENKKKLSENDI